MRHQCKQCPWKKNTDPNQIPNGYSVEKHKALKSTIAESGSFHNIHELRIMACHDSPVGKEKPCVGWLVQQLGPGNNLSLRFAVIIGHIDPDVATVGPQHQCFEDTLPSR